MPPEGPPPLPNAHVTEGGQQIDYVQFVGDDTAGDYYVVALKEMAEAVLNQDDRWRAILMLRIARLRLHGRSIDVNAFRLLPGWAKEVYRVGRISEVSRVLGVESIAKNPHHVDVDWYGDNPAHWWNTDAFTGAEAEIDAARGQLHFLEDTVGLRRSRIDPSGWSWPPGTNTNDFWPQLVASTASPPILAGRAAIKVEWHMGRSPDRFTYDWDQAKFWFMTPALVRDAV